MRRLIWPRVPPEAPKSTMKWIPAKKSSCSYDLRYDRQLSEEEDALLKEYKQKFPSREFVIACFLSNVDVAFEWAVKRVKCDLGIIKSIC